MVCPIKLLLITPYLLWGEACREALKSRSEEISVTLLVSDGNLSSELIPALVEHPNVALVSLSLPSGGVKPFDVLRAAGYVGPIVVTCSHYALPAFGELSRLGVQGVISSLATLDELATLINTVTSGHPEPLLQQYVRTTRTLTHEALAQNPLNEREKQILELVANDLTDQEIAVRLSLSNRTVSTYLSSIYTKLGVRGRAGAVSIALLKGMLNPDILGAQA